MITKEIRYKICSKALEKNGEITTKQLMSLGLKKHDIQKLVKEGTLTRLKRGLYQFNVDVLYRYGLSFLAEARLPENIDKKAEYIDMANDCFKRCHEVDEKNRSVNLYLLFHFIVTKKYKEAFNLLECMYNTDVEDDIKENNLFLYLLSCYGNCPSSLYKRISCIECNDLGFTGWNNDVDKLIIAKIYAQQFGEARDLISNLVVKNDVTRVKKNILSTLLKGNLLNVSFADLRAVLKENRVNDFYMLLSVYLRIIGKEEYFYLITWLTKLCVLDNDLTFDMVFRELVELEKCDYYDVSALFICDFYQYIAAGKYKQAVVCLKIIEKYGNLSPEILADLRKQVGGVEENTSLDLASNKEVTYDSVKDELSRIIKVMRNDKEIVHVILDVSSRYSDYANLIFRKNGSSSEFKNIKFWSFGNNSQTIVLRLIDPKIAKINISERLKAILSCFKSGQYDACINLVEELLQYESYEFGSLKDTRALFYILGESYIKNVNLKLKSRKILALVTRINSNLPKELQDDKYDFTFLIDKLSGKKARNYQNHGRNKVNAKAKAVLPSRTEVKWEGFFGENASSDDVDLRLTRLQDVLYTSVELEQSLDDVVKEYDLTNEDILLMYLIKARDYYIDNLYQEGDNELRKVTLSSNKTPLVESLMQQVLSHKFDYRRMTSNYSKKRVCFPCGDEAA